MPMVLRRFRFSLNRRRRFFVTVLRRNATVVTHGHTDVFQLEFAAKQTEIKPKSRNAIHVNPIVFAQ